MFDPIETLPSGGRTLKIASIVALLSITRGDMIDTSLTAQSSTPSLTSVPAAASKKPAPGNSTRPST